MGEHRIMGIQADVQENSLRGGGGLGQVSGAGGATCGKCYFLLV